MKLWTCVKEVAYWGFVEIVIVISIVIILIFVTKIFYPSYSLTLEISTIEVASTRLKEQLKEFIPETVEEE